MNSLGRHRRKEFAIDQGLDFHRRKYRFWCSEYARAAGCWSSSERYWWLGVDVAFRHHHVS